MKAFATDNSKVAEKIEFFVDRTEKIVTKEEMVVTGSFFFLFPQCFQNASVSSKSALCDKGLKCC